MRLTKRMTALTPFLSMVTHFTSWNERRRRRKANEMRLATLLNLVLTLPVTTALVYSQEVHYNYERGRTSLHTKPINGSTPLPPHPNRSSKRAEGRRGRSTKPSCSAKPPHISAHLPRRYTMLSRRRIGHPRQSSEDQLINQEIKRAVEEQLAQKGLIKVDKNADLQVRYHATIRQEQSLYMSGLGWGGGGWGGPWNGSVQGQTSSVPIGTIVVDLYDPAQKQLIWRGDATKTIDLKKDPDKNYKDLQKAMAKLFKNYPPQPKK